MRQSSQRPASGSGVGTSPARADPEKVSEQLERWLRIDGDKTVGSLIDLFKAKSFAILFVLLLGVPALPLPTGGVTHVFELIAVLLALQLIIGREQIWLPQRWRKLDLAGEKQQRFLAGLLKMIRRLERFSVPACAPCLTIVSATASLGCSCSPGARVPSSLRLSRDSTPCRRSA